jgi:hypothetical protein
MTGFTKFLFFVFLVICLVSGLLLLIVPGRFLYAVGWAPVEPMIIRLLGAALLAFAWGSWKGLRAADLRQTLVVMEMLIVFTLLGAIGWFRHLLVAYYWPSLWAIAACLLVLGLVWVFIRLSAGKIK